MEKPKRVIVISGPTATGKTALGVELCLRLGGEVISADSMQVYRGLDIGTAKVAAEEARGVPHHMVGVAEPGEDFSVSRWVDGAAKCAEDIFARGKVPVIVGGTGLYIDSLLSGRDFAAADTDGELRARLSREYDEFGGEAFRERLREADPERAAVLHPADKKRLVRAMEIFLLTGETITAHDERTRSLPPRWESARFALSFADRQALYARIDARVDSMVRRGLFEEVRSLAETGKISPECSAMQAIGYKEAVEYIEGRAGAEEAVEQIKQASRRYAKRQLTWLRRDAGLEWILWDGAPDPGEGADMVLRALARGNFFKF
ncbi:MAG: tRNA (adenosine(37)-N6)-dimethylallyltransferase MiaA [Butyricicoccus sp.]|nr:tRNA (adenosine(37)-N6)-dimethylallyltransferase MiaA [Butyricicoccus sp.]